MKGDDNKNEFKLNRINHKLFGNGSVIVRLVGGYGSLFSMVKFDIDPPMEYNMGENPCLMFSDELNEISATET